MAALKYKDSNGNYQTVVGLNVQNEVVQTTGTSTTAVMSQNAVTNALSGKVDKENGKVLSTNDYTTNEKTKLNGIPSDSKAASSGGTELSLVTTGEKSVWNGKFSSLGGKLTGNALWLTPIASYTAGEHGIIALINDSGLTDTIICSPSGIISIGKLGYNGFSFNLTNLVGSKEVIINNTGGFQPESNNTVTLGGLGSEYAEFDSRVVFVRHINGSRTFARDHGDAGLYLNHSDNVLPAGHTFINDNNDGCVGIGTTSVSHKLTVNGGVSASGVYVGLAHIGDSAIGFNRITNTGQIIDETKEAGQIHYDQAQGGMMFSIFKPFVGICLFMKNNGNVAVGNNTNPSYKLHVDGAVGATVFTNTSDIRKKDIIENVNLDVEDIANAPLFKFSWLDPDMPEGVNVGTSAQYWQTIIPEIVSEANDDEKTLSMQYGVAGLASSVALARKVVEQENTIKAQEARIKALEDAIAEIQNKLK